MDLHPSLAVAAMLALGLAGRTEPVAAQRSRPPAIASPVLAPRTALPVAPTAPAPAGPAPQNVRVLPGGPAAHTLAWDRLPGVSGYTVAIRTASSAGQFLLLTAQPILSESYVHATVATSYEVFRVTAHYPDGRQGVSEFTYLDPPQPKVPVGFVAQQVAPGQVRLSWQPVPYAVAYRVFGSGQSRDGAAVTALDLTLSDLPDGVHSWQVTADYGGISTNVGLPMVTVTLKTVVTGRYRVVANGLRVLHETIDDALERDGKRDEVYGAFVSLHFDRNTGQRLDQDLRRTKVHGDVNLPNRERAGSAGPAGGLMSSDAFPNQPDPSRRTPAQVPGDYTLPFVVWEGTLTNATDAMVIIPTLWEFDNESSAYDHWVAGELNGAADIWAEPAVQLASQGTRLGLITSGETADMSVGASFNLKNAYVSVFGQAWLGLFLGHSSDRPIGFGYAGRPDLPRRAIVLTREIIEATLNGPKVAAPIITSSTNAWLLPYVSLSTDIVSVVLMDQVVGGHRLDGVYVLYLQVERVP